jgi:YHS domain-containing protein
MNLLRKLSLVAIFLGAASIAVGAETKQAPKKAATPPVLKHQTLCPVMGDEIDSSQYLDIQGQRVYFCCKKCEAKLKADPDKYFKQAAADSVLFENIQTSCPVSGKPIDTSVYVDYQGRRLFFCCDKCPVEFAKDPQSILKKMDQPPAKPSK